MNGASYRMRECVPIASEAKSSASFKMNYGRARIRARCGLEQQHWTEAANLEPDPGVQPQVAAISYWAAALGAAHTENLQAAQQHVEQVRRLADDLRRTGEEDWADQVTIQAQKAAAWLAFVEHRSSDPGRM